MSQKLKAYPTTTIFSDSQIDIHKQSSIPNDEDFGHQESPLSPKSDTTLPKTPADFFLADQMLTSKTKLSKSDKKNIKKVAKEEKEKRKEEELRKAEEEKAKKKEEAKKKVTWS
jgi:hypothetical protein